MAGTLRNARSHTDDTDARAGVRFKFRAFDVLITFRAANKKTGIRRPSPAKIATSATLFRLVSALCLRVAIYSTKTGSFHGLHLHPAHEEGPPHYGAKAGNEHTSLLQVG